MTNAGPTSDCVAHWRRYQAATRDHETAFAELRRFAYAAQTAGKVLREPAYLRLVTTGEGDCPSSHDDTIQPHDWPTWTQLVDAVRRWKTAHEDLEAVWRDMPGDCRVGLKAPVEKYNLRL